MLSLLATGADPGFREGGFLLLGRAKRRNFWVDHAPFYMPRPLMTGGVTMVAGGSLEEETGCRLDASSRLLY